MNVPDGWRVALLSDVCTVGPRDPALPETAPFVPMDAVKVGVREPAYYEPRGKRGGIRAKGNDLLFARITPCLENGKVSLLPPSSGPTGGSTEFLVVRPGTNVDPLYLYLWSLSPAVRDRAKAEMTGTTGRMRLSGSALGALPFPHPPLPEQRRIVEMVEEHMAHLASADASLASAEQRAQAMLTAATNSALARSNGEEVPLEQLITCKLRNGRSVPTHPGGFPVLRLTCLTNGAEVDLTQSKEGAWGESEAEKFLVSEGDFLISRGNGSLNRVARGALVGKVERPVAIPDTIIRARPDVTKIDPNYLSIAWTSTKVRRQIQSRAKTTAGIYKVSQGDLSSVVVPVPHMDAQLAIVSQLQQLRESTTRLTEQLLAHEQRSAALRRAVLAAAFSGHLTPPAEATGPLPGEPAGA